MRIGNLTYVDKKMELGSLRGNEFEIVLRDVREKPAENEASSGDATDTADLKEINEDVLHEVRVFC